MVGAGPGRARMRTPAQNRAETTAPPARSPVPQQRLLAARGVLVGVILGLFAWACVGLLLWLLV
jgi:hypothetical protein